MVFIPIYRTIENTEYTNDDTKLQNRIDELEDEISRITGVETEGTWVRRKDREHQSKKWDVILKMKEMEKSYLKLLIYGDLFEEYEFPYLYAPKDCFSVFDHSIYLDNDAFYIATLKDGWEKKPDWIHYNVRDIKKKKFGIFNIKTGYRMLEITAPKIVLDYIEKDYKKEYLPKLLKIKEKHPLDTKIG